jgi:hypothetical protein
LANLCKALPETWPEALKNAWQSHPRPQRSSNLSDILVRGTDRILPTNQMEIKLVSARRSALGRLLTTLPQILLAEIDERKLEELIRSYRKIHSQRSSAILSSDITELRMTINSARIEAGMPPIRYRRIPQPRRRQGRKTYREVATLEYVNRLLKKTEGWLRIFILLRIVTTVPDESLLRLQRKHFDLQKGRIRVDMMATRRPGMEEGRLVFGLPVWCVEQIRSTFRVFDAWNSERFLFPSKKNPYHPRREVSHALYRAAESSVCVGVTSRSLRLLAQSIHAKAPRAVRRATAKSRLDVPRTIMNPQDQRVAEAQEKYAAWVVRNWRVLFHPPVTLKRVSKRASKNIFPEMPEQSPFSERSHTALVPSCQWGAQEPIEYKDRPEQTSVKVSGSATGRQYPESTSLNLSDSTMDSPNVYYPEPGNWSMRDTTVWTDNNAQNSASPWFPLICFVAGGLCGYAAHPYVSPWFK